MGVCARGWGSWRSAVAAIAAAVAGGGRARPGRRSQPRPNIVVVMTDDQTPASLPMMPTRRLRSSPPTGRRSPTTSPTGRCAARRGRPSTPASTRTTTACSATARPTAASPASTTPSTLPVWLQHAGYHTIHIGKYLNGYEDRAPTGVPPGWTEWHGSKPPTATTASSCSERATTTSSNQNEHLDLPGTTRDRLQAGRLHRHGRRRDQPQRAAEQARSSSGVAYLAPHAGGPNPNPTAAEPTASGTAKPATRHAGAFDDEPLPKPPNFNEADVSDKPAAIRQLPPLDRRRRSPTSSATTAAGSSRCSRSTRASGGSSTRCGHRRARQHAGHLHLRQRLLPRRAPGRDRQEPRLRGGDPGAAADARARGPRGRHGRRPRRSTPTWRRRSSTPPARPPGLHRGRRARCCRSPPIPTAATAASC